EGRMSREAAGELDAHIDRCAECRELLGAIARIPGGHPKAVAAMAVADTIGEPTMGGGASATDLEPIEGGRIGRVLVVHMLGPGGMGTVYQAYDPDLDRKVALKILRVRAGGTDHDAREHMLREGRAIARLTHPNVVAVHDVGTHEESVFIAMEHVDGLSLD